MIHPSNRVVTFTPLEELWSATIGVGNPRCLGVISQDDLTELLRQGPFWFVVANVGQPLVWIDPKECYEFWQSEVKPHLVVGDEIDLESYPDEYAYVAKRWTTKLAAPVSVLEKHH